MHIKVHRDFFAGMIVIMCLWTIPIHALAAPGNGLRSGNYQLSPSLKVGTGYDSNIYYLTSEDGGALPASPTGFLSPGLKINTTNINGWSFVFDGGLTWRQYFSEDKAIAGQSGLSTNLKGHAILNPDGAVSLRISESFTRANETPNYYTASPFSRINNQLGATLGFHPGGRVLQSYLGYELGVHRHNTLTDLNRLIHHFSMRNYWKFLPKTAIVLNADYRMIRYSSPFGLRSDGSALEFGGRMGNVNSNPLKLRGGLDGLVTRRVSVKILGGYGWSYHDIDPSFEGIIGTLEASYRLSAHDDKNRVRLGYERNFNDSSLGNFDSFHRIYSGYTQFFWRERLKLDFGVDARLKHYGLNDEQMLVSQTEDGQMLLPEDLADMLVSIRTDFAYKLSNAWMLELGYRFNSNLTDDEVIVELPAAENIGRAYLRHALTFGATFRY